MLKSTDNTDSSAPSRSSKGLEVSVHQLTLTDTSDKRKREDWLAGERQCGINAHTGWLVSES